MHFQYAFFIADKKYAFQYAFLMAPRFSQNMHFAMGKCIYLYIFWLDAENAYFLDCSNQRFACIFDSSIFFRNMHFSMGKCICFCFSAGCRKCIFHSSLILSKNQGFHGIMHF